MSCCESLLLFVGLVVVARWVLYAVWDILAAIRKFGWARLQNPNLATKYGGKWAVVTGCTDGIGKEYARQLARRGMNILLISRNIDKLNNVQQLIKSESPGVETETVQVDFSHGRVIYPKIGTHIQGKDIGILVNNVGVAMIPSKTFIEANEDEIWSLVNVNVASVVAMTQLVLAQMVARGSGAIINIASVASSCPLPYNGIYSGTKAFVDFFSQSLAWECRGTGVTVQTIRPAGVVTNMIDYYDDFKKPSVIAPSPATFVASALPTLGHSSRTTGHWSHGLQIYIMESLPAYVGMSMVERMAQSMRAKLEKKK